MIKRLVILFVLFISLYSCQHEVEQPSNLIPREQMKAIIKDLYIYKNLEEISYIQRKEDKPKDIHFAILEKHQVSVEDFQESYQYYAVQNAAFDELLIEIKEELQQSEYAPKKDSIQVSND